MNSGRSTSRADAAPLATQTADRTLLERLALLHIVITVLLGALLTVRATHSLWVLAAFQLPAVLLDLSAWWLARKNRVRAGGWLLVVSLTVPQLVSPLAMGGLVGHMLMALSVAVMLTGVVVGWRPAVAVAVLVSAVTLAYGLLQDAGVLTPDYRALNGLNAWGSIAATLAMCLLLLSQTVWALREALRQAQQRELERDEANRKFLTTQKMELVGRLSSGIAHDFNNLLSVIRGGAEFIELTQPPNEELTSALRDIDGATERAALMTRQLLSLGRARVDEAHVVVDLSAVVASQARLLPRLLGSRISVDCHAPTPVYVYATPAGLEQILLNLAVNARDAMPTGGALSLHVREEGGRARLDVRDTGVGMAEEVRAKMFEPFFTTRPLGTGLGLATVKELVTRFGGAVSVESAPGKGACFTVQLPLAAAPAELASSPVRDSRSVRRRRVVLVEDNELLRRELTKLMLVAGLDVSAVCDGDEALALLEGARGVDAVLSDISMSRTGGDTMAVELRRRGLRLPIIFFSGNAAPAALPENTSFLAKPISMAQLAAELERVCPAR